MKKSIFILFLAIVASVTVTWAQAPNLGGTAECPTPTPISTTCLGADALHPVPGSPYDYEVSVPTPGGTKYYNWLVTQDQTFIDATGLVATPEIDDGTGPHIQATGSGYNDPGVPPTPGSGTNTINITWKYWTHDPDLPVFLVIYVLNENTCQTDNIQVYIIEPQHSFTLDIANIALDGLAQADLFPQCAALVASSTYDIPSGTVMNDYGVNYMFFAVTAANYFDSWLPSFETTGAGLIGSRDITAVDWAYPAEAETGTWHTMTEGPDNLWTTNTEAVEAQIAGGTVGSDGECIIVRVTVTNNQQPALTDMEISLATDGVMYDPINDDYANAALADIHWADCTADGFTNDIITQVLTSRPDIQAVTPTPFVPNDDN